MVICKRFILKKESDELSKDNVFLKLKTDYIAKNIYFYESTDSTNTRALAESKKNAPNGSLFIAESQTAGSGRMGKTWNSSKGKDILMSVLLYMDIPMTEIPKLTLITGFSVCKFLRCKIGIDAKIKWPNDIVVGSKKLCGILVKTSPSKKKTAVSVGIGINVNSNSFSDDIAKKATSLYNETGMKLNRCELIADVLRYFERDYFEFLKTYKIPINYNKLCCSINREVTAIQNGRNVTGIAIGIDQMGNLKVKCGGDIYIINSGEVLIQNIYDS